MNARSVLEALLEGPKFKLPLLPREHGVYALLDHMGQVKYIGKAVETDFRNRINSRHTTGSEGNSHKFSHTYNTGRMWRAKNDSGPDARRVKAFRAIFIREFCSARVVRIDGDALEISSVEASVISIASAANTDWNDRRFHRAPEPVTLVDELVSTQRNPSDIIASMQHQLALFRQDASS